jgi:AcrR family transcriptional regulator
MARDATATREKLLDAAARLFAERGIAAVSLTEINTAAGQRNSSALQYHFRSRDGLLEQLVRRHVPVIAAHRRLLLAEATALPHPDPRQAAAAFVVPIADMLRGDWRDRAFVRIIADLTTDPTRDFDEVGTIVGDSAALPVVRLLAAAAGPLPAVLSSERLRVSGLMVLHALADEARRLDTGRRHDPEIGHDVFVANLIDMYLAASLTPPSAATLDLIAPAELTSGPTSPV